MPTRTKGVEGDHGTYEFVLMIEGSYENISSREYETLARLSTNLTNEIREINRVVLLTGGPLMSDDEVFIDNYFVDMDM